MGKSWKKRVISGIIMLLLLLPVMLTGRAETAIAETDIAEPVITEEFTAYDYNASVIGFPRIWSTSVLFFGEDENAAHLIDDMLAERIPNSCQVLYDFRGTRPEVTVTDPQTIIRIYNRLADVHIKDEQDKTIEGGDHHIIFNLQDGSSVSFEFQGENLFRKDGRNYLVDDSEDLWAFIFDLQEAFVEYGEEGPYPILVEKGADMLIDCPREAMAGETVRIETVFAADGEVYVFVNDERTGTFIKENVFEFVMPQGPARLKAGISSAGYSGA